jgi:hypothetical protein
MQARWLKAPRAAHGLLISRALYDQIASEENVNLARRLGGRLHILDAEIVTLNARAAQRDAVRESSGV